MKISFVVIIFLISVSTYAEDLILKLEGISPIVYFYYSKIPLDFH